MTYQPEQCKKKCEWIDCYAGLGLAGSGCCFANGMWWSNDCLQFKDNDKYEREEKIRWVERLARKLKEEKGEVT